MRLKTAAATAPALEVQTRQSRPLPARLRAVSGKGAASSAPVKPMATSASLHSRTAPKAAPGASLLSAVPRRAAQPGSAKARLTKTSVAQLNAAQQNAKLARRDRVVLEHLPLVKAIAIRVHESRPVPVDADDLVHSG